jgi:hypothetical protein
MVYSPVWHVGNFAATALQEEDRDSKAGAAAMNAGA